MQDAEQRRGTALEGGPPTLCQQLQYTGLGKRGGKCRADLSVQHFVSPLAGIHCLFSTEREQKGVPKLSLEIKVIA